MIVGLKLGVGFFAVGIAHTLAGRLMRTCRRDELMRTCRRSRLTQANYGCSGRMPVACLT